MQHLTGFETLAERYDGFLLDLWGVIHDGVAPYPGAIDALSRLRARGKRIVFLSNAPRRAAVARAHLHEMGLSDELYDGIVTSGEQTWRWLADRDEPWFARLGDRAFFLGTERDRSVLDGLALTLAPTPLEADFVVNTGPDDLDAPTEVGPFEPVLGTCRAAGLPMLCANPDLYIVRDGRHIICAGALAERYEALGGDVRWVGKPDAAIYPPALALLGLPPSRVLAAGDALRTDIAGAAAAGLDSCWVLDGIHGNELERTPAAIERAAAEAGLSPDASLPRFVW